MDVALGHVIATRVVRWVPFQGDITDVSILLGTPQNSDEFGAVIMPFQIVGLGRERVKFGAGTDGIQAFLLTLRMIRTDLEFLQDQLNGRLIWLDDESGSCGLVDSEHA